MGYVCWVVFSLATKSVIEDTKNYYLLERKIPMIDIKIPTTKIEGFELPPNQLNTPTAVTKTPTINRTRGKITTIFLRESNTLFSFLHHFKNYSSIPLDTVSIVSRNSFTCDIGNRVKESFMTCGAVISNCIRCCMFRNPDHNPQVILFEVLI